MATSGIGSNLDVNGIVSQLMTVEARPLTALAKKEASFQAKLSAYGSVSSALGSFQSALKSLSTPERFQSVTAVPGDADIFSATATTKSVAGSYAINVTQLAKAQTIATEGLASTSAAIGDGLKTTLTFEFGTISGGKLTDGRYADDATATPPAVGFAQDPKRAMGTVIIDSSNNSLQGIRDAINKAGLGVTATIVADGSDTPNHLVLTSDKTGAASSMKISVAREAGAPADSALADLLSYDPQGTQNMKQSSAALDTTLTVNGIDIRSATTTVTEAMQGVTLNVKKIGESSLKVARDVESVKSAVNAFVKAYNDLDRTIGTLTSYDDKTRQAGLLLGDSSLRAIDTQVKGMLTSNLEGSKLSNLMQLGITFQKDGSLSVDGAKLDKAIASNFDDIAGLFASVGTASDSLVTYGGSSEATKPGNRSLYITTLASQGKLQGAAAPGTLVIAAGGNDQLSMNVDGVSATITLPAKTYTAEALAAAMQSAINGSSEFTAKEIGVSVTVDATGALSVVSNRYGSASKVSAGGNGASNLFGTLPTITDGLDVAGTIDGVKADGSGQNLTGARGSAADGLKLTIEGGALGNRGTVAFSQGFAHRLTALMDGFSGSKGTIAAQTAGLNSAIKLLGKQEEAINTRLAAIEKRYRAQFTALDGVLSSMNNTSTYLTQQLEQISKLSSQ